MFYFIESNITPQFIEVLSFTLCSKIRSTFMNRCYIPRQRGRPLAANATESAAEIVRLLRSTKDRLLTLGWP